MKNIDHLSQKERQKLLFEMSPETESAFRELDRNSIKLLSLSLREMECDEQEDGDFDG